MKYANLSVLSLLSLSMVMFNAFAMNPITDADIDNVNKILTLPMAQQKARKMFQEDKGLAKRFKLNENATNAFINNEVIKYRCELIDQQFSKSLSGITQANKTINQEVSALSNSKIEGFETSISQDSINQELGKVKELLRLTNLDENKFKMSLEEKVKGRDKIKVDEMQGKWGVALIGILKNKKGLLQSDIDLTKENCNKFILPFQGELSKRANGTTFQKETYELWSGTYKSCKSGNVAGITSGISQTGDLMSKLSVYYSQYDINELKDNLKDIVEIKNKINTRITDLEVKALKSSEAAKDYSLAAFRDEVCTPVLKSAGLISDSVRDSGYTEGLNVAQVLDSSIEKLKATCNGESIKKEVLASDYKQIVAALADADLFNKKLENTAKRDKAECARSLEVYSVLRKKELRAYSDLIEEEKAREEEKSKQEQKAKEEVGASAQSENGDEENNGSVSK